MDAMCVWFVCVCTRYVVCYRNLVYLFQFYFDIIKQQVKFNVQASQFIRQMGEKDGGGSV